MVYTRLKAANYKGLRELMRKGKRLRSLCEQYDSFGVLNVNVR